MKFIYFFFIATLFCSANTFAQTLEIENGQVLYDKKSRPAILIKINPETKEVKKSWKKFIQKEHDVDVDGIGLFTNKDILKTEKAIVKSISDKQIDLFAKIVENEELTEISVFGSFGYDLYISPAEFPQEYAAMENIVFDFLNKLLPEYLKENVEELEDQLTDLKDNLNDKKDNIEDNKKDIAQMKEKIQALEKENKNMQKDLADEEEQVRKTATKLKVKKRNIATVKSTLQTAGDN